MSDYETIIIGSGAGGLTAALCLARKGQKVLVLEQHYLPGGWCHSFSLNGFMFSPGVHYIGGLEPGGLLRKAYEGLGVANDLTFLELNPEGIDHVVIGDKRFDIPKGKEKYIARIKAEFPLEARAIDRFFRIISSIARAIDGWDGIVSAIRLVTTGLKPIDSLLDRCGIKDARLRAILTMQAGDHGMGPSEAPAAVHAGVMAHYFNGGYYPKGGGRAIPRAFIRALKRHGGEIRLRAKVAKILLDASTRKRKALGVELEDGTKITAANVISNADPHVTFDQLVGSKHLSRKLRQQLDRTEYSISALSLFFATDLDLESMGLDSGNVWYSKTARIEDVYDLAKDPSPFHNGELPGVFLTVTTLKDRSKRKDGLHTMESFCFVSYEGFEQWKESNYDDRPEDYEAMKEELTQMMFKRLDEIVPHLSDHVVFCALGTPLTNVHYINSIRGNLYGTSKKVSQIGPWAYRVKTEINGLFMCGASTLAHGVAGATMSGIAAATKVANCRDQDFFGAENQHLKILPCDNVDAWPLSMRPETERRTEYISVAKTGQV